MTAADIARRIILCPLMALAILTGAPARSKVHIAHLGFAEQAAAHTEQAEEYQQVRACFEHAWPHVLTALKQKWEPAAVQVKPATK